ncbi:MAG: hypothetical protein JNK15_13690 [Planctomycetes bacterium]|nr:hypothetical protein [Planctomycetota bacterium]
MIDRLGTLRSWLLRAATALLAFAFAMPACTVLLWRDDRSLRTEEIQIDAPTAYRVEDCPTAFFVHLPEAAVRTLRGHAPELPTDLAWLRVQAHDDGFADNLRLACDEDRPHIVCLNLFRRAPGQPAFWAIDPVRWGTWLSTPSWAARHADARCDVAILAERPRLLGPPVHGLAIAYATCNDDGTPVLTRIALTPLALAGDTLLAAAVVVTVAIAIPIYPFVWFGQQIAGDDTK